MTDLTLARSKAWNTRRAKYGPSGHGRSYRCGPTITRHNDGALRLVIELLNEGVLSEGQVCQATGIDRVDVRRMADELGGPRP